MTDRERKIKKRLIDMDKDPTWLINEVAKETGLYFDSGYLSKIYRGARKAPKITAAIDKILSLPESAAS